MLQSASKQTNKQTRMQVYVVVPQSMYASGFCTLIMWADPEFPDLLWGPVEVHVFAQVKGWWIPSGPGLGGADRLRLRLPFLLWFLLFVFESPG